MGNNTERYLERLFADADFVELRHQVGKRWDTTWHATPEDLLDAARGKAGTGNLFTSLNHVAGYSDGPVGNDNIDRYCRILFDLDPVRDSGTASTDWELEQATERAAGLRKYLAGHGWPMPAVGMSGNGAHLQYRTAIPNREDNRLMLRVLYRGLAERFGDDVVGFDEAVKNPGRICTLYGSMKRKGPGTEERPHRRSTIEIPRDWRQVSLKQVQKLAGRYIEQQKPKKTKRLDSATSQFAGKGDFSTLDIVSLFQANDSYVGHLHSNVHAVRCPWSAEHSSHTFGDAVIFEPSHGWPGFHCKHSHCAGRTIRDVLSIWDADRFCAREYVRKEVENV